MEDVNNSNLMRLIGPVKTGANVCPTGLALALPYQNCVGFTPASKNSFINFMLPWLLPICYINYDGLRTFQCGLETKVYTNGAKITSCSRPRRVCCSPGCLFAQTAFTFRRQLPCIEGQSGESPFVHGGGNEEWKLPRLPTTL